MPTKKEKMIKKVNKEKAKARRNTRKQAGAARKARGGKISPEMKKLMRKRGA